MNSSITKLIVACVYSCVVLAFAFVLIYSSCCKCCLHFFKNIIGFLLVIYAMAFPIILTYVKCCKSDQDKTQSSSPVPSMTEEKVRQIVNETIRSADDEHIDEIKKVYKDCFNYLTKK